jgi:hypothetical protein
MKRINLIRLSILLCLFVLLLPQGNSQTVQEEDECDIKVFTGVRTYPPGSSDRFDWECRGEGLSCTEVYIICPRTL